MKKDIIKLLFNGQLNEGARDLKEFSDTKEFKERNEAYNKMEATFSEEQKDLFDEYFLWDCGCFSLELERVYANGLKTGFWLATELADFKPNIDE